jgi:protein-tyrosine phosphatase
MKILMVCLGNICRSPIADGLLRQKVIKADLLVEVDSAGTSAFHIGQSPDKRMIETAKHRNTDISYLHARQFTHDDFDQFDLIYAMDKSNLKNILSLTTNETHKSKVRLILTELENFNLLEVPDPYYGGDDGFIAVYDMLDQATDQIILKIKANKLL